MRVLYPKFIFVGLMVLLIPVFFIYAGNPSTPIAPGDNIQDPGDTGTAWGGCGPTDSNCYVTLDTSSFFAQGGNSFGATATFGTSDNNALVFRTNGSERARFLSSGNFGIGDATPAALFTVGSGDLFQVDSSGNTTIQNQSDLRLGDSDGSNYVAFQAPGTVSSNVTWTLPAADATGCFQSNGSGVISFTSCGGGGLSDGNYGDITVSGSGTAMTVNSNSVALTTDTTGNYVASVTNGSGISGGDGGSEGAGLTLSLGALTGDWNQTGAFDISLNNASSELKILESSGATFFGIFDVTDLSVSDKTYTFPNANITVNAAADISGTTLASNVVTSSLTTVGALGTGSITSGFGAIDVGADNITTTGSVFANAFDRTTSGSLDIANTNATGISLCASNTCDTLSIGSGFDADNINLGDSNDTVSVTGASGSSFVLNGTTVSSSEFNVLDNGIELGDLTTQSTATDEFCLTSETGGGALLQWQACGGGSTALNSITAAGGTNTIDNTNFAQQWDWSTASTQNPFIMTANALTSGKLLTLSSSSTAFTGNIANFTLSGSNSANTGAVVQIDNTGTASTNTALIVNHYATGTNNLALRVNDVSGDATPFVIDGTGNVGIGTAAPSVPLQVVGRIRQDADYGMDAFLQTNGLNHSDLTSINPGISVFNDTANVFGYNLGYNSGTGRYSNQAFFSDVGDFVIASETQGVPLPTAAADFTPRVTVRGDSGNVGIATSAPTSLFSVGSSSQFQVNSSGALVAGSITSGFGAIDVGADNLTTTGSVFGNDHDRTTAGALTFGNTNATSISLCNSAACDTLSIGTNADADAINIGDSLDTVSLVGASGSSFVLNGTTVSSSEFNVLDNGIELGDLTTQSTATDEFCLTSETGGGALLQWQNCGGGGVTLANIGSSANADGATLTGSILNLEPASASFGGVVTTGTQSFAGAKTFTGNTTLGDATSDTTSNLGIYSGGYSFNDGLAGATTNAFKYGTTTGYMGTEYAMVAFDNAGTQQIRIEPYNGVLGVPIIDFPSGTGGFDFFNYRTILASGTYDYALSSKSASGAGLVRLRINGNYDIANVTFENSWVGIVDTTPDYMLDVANTGADTNIFSLTDSDGECLHNPESGSEVVSCSSDQRLKTNIVDSGLVLDYFNSFHIREYDVIASGNHMTGVVAQEVLQNHPELVTMGSNGMYSVQLPDQWKMVKAIQELDLKISNIQTLHDDTFLQNVRMWLGDSSNQIMAFYARTIFADTIKANEKVCIGGTCITESQLHDLMQNAGLLNQNSPNNPPDPASGGGGTSGGGSEGDGSGPTDTPPPDEDADQGSGDTDGTTDGGDTSQGEAPEAPADGN